MSTSDERFPGEFHEIAERLRTGRPQATALELDRVKVQVRNRVVRASTNKGSFMKSRLAITSMLVVGLLMSMGGAGLAISGGSGSGSASVAQYQPKTVSGGGVLGVVNSGNKHNNNECTETSNGTSGTEGTSNSGSECAPATVRQVAATSSGSLPFTGYAGGAALILGLGLLLGGVLLRRQTHVE